MRSNDLTVTRDDVRTRLMQALVDNDRSAYEQAFNDMIGCIEDDINQRHADYINEVREEADRKVLAERGVRQLTSEEHKYYQKFAEAARSKDPKQALVNADLVMPKTIMNAVFDELQTSHPLLPSSF